MVTPKNIQDLPNSDLKNVATEILERYISLAERSINEKRWGTSYDDGVTYLAAHLLVQDMSGGRAPVGAVTSESAGPLSRTYSAYTSNDSLDATSYGRTFKLLRDALPRAPLVP